MFDYFFIIYVNFFFFFLVKKGHLARGVHSVRLIFDNFFLENSLDRLDERLSKKILNKQKILYDSQEKIRLNLIVFFYYSCKFIRILFFKFNL